MSVKVKVSTTAGVFLIELYTDRMPKSCARFTAFVKERFYDGTHFHRVVPGALVQGGDPLSRDMKDPTVGTGGSKLGTFADEHVAQITNSAGTIGFCTQNRNDSADCQFYVNLADNSHLDWWRGGGQAPFGKVIEGLAVVRAIAAGPHTGRVVGERPKKPIRIISATLL